MSRKTVMPARVEVKRFVRPASALGWLAQFSDDARRASFENLAGCAVAKVPPAPFSPELPKASTSVPRSGTAERQVPESGTPTTASDSVASSRGSRKPDAYLPKGPVDLRLLLPRPIPGQSAPPVTKPPACVRRHRGIDPNVSPALGPVAKVEPQHERIGGH